MTKQVAAGERVLAGPVAESVAVMLAVGGGGIVGAIGRWRLAETIGERWPTEFPWGTLVVNLTGCAILGWYLGYLARRERSQPLARLAIATGVLGAYTTFSAFAYETVRLLQHGRVLIAATYVAASLGLGLLVTAAGLRLARTG